MSGLRGATARVLVSPSKNEKSQVNGRSASPDLPRMGAFGLGSDMSLKCSTEDLIVFASGNSDLLF